MTKGVVYLIGAGPGDPGLITVKGVDCIREADVVVYDYLANKKLLSYAKKDAEVIYVGKQGGSHTMTQRDINALIVERAGKGKVVARLKGGDPFIFGRGGEEAEELADAGIHFEVVPGVTSAIAAPAYAGIPLTHRAHTATVAFITGHEDPSKVASSINWEKISSGAGTLVFLMGIKNLGRNVDRLIEYGRDPSTPAAIVRWGTTQAQETVVGRLDNIVQLAEDEGIKPPAITVIGSVVSLRDRLKWFETRPLFGLKVLVTRSREQMSHLVSLLERSGAEVIEFPTIKTVDPDDFTPLDTAIREISKYDWTIFTSVNGVKYFIERLKKSGFDIRELKGAKICTIGPATAAAIEALGIKVDLVPEEYVAESIIKALGKETIEGKRFLLPRAVKAREVLPREIEAMGGRVDVVPAYRTVCPENSTDDVRSLLESGKVSAITFTSSSTVDNFMAMFGAGEGTNLLTRTKVACIGPITAKKARGYSLTVDIIAGSYTVSGLTDAIIDYFSTLQN